MPTASWCRFVVLLVSGLAAGGLTAAESKWIKISAPEFTVVTTLKAADAQDWAEEFSQFISALGRVVPVDKRRLQPITMVIFARNADFESYRPALSDGTPSDVAGFFGRRESWAAVGMSGSRRSANTRSIIFHEGVHWYMSGFDNRRPTWLEEGLAEVFSTLELQPKQMIWGKPVTNHLLWLNNTPLIPMEEFLYYGRERLMHGSGLQMGLFYAQSWALVHYLLFGQHDLPPNALNDYMRLSGTAMHPDEVFKASFGVTYEEMQARLATYVRGGRHNQLRPPRVTVAAMAVEPASAVEVEAALGRLALVGKWPAKAMQHALAAVKAAPDSPLGYELQGQILSESGDGSAATEAFTLAADRKTRDYRIYLRLAQSLQRSGAATQSAMIARQVANRYKQAVNANPFNLATYQSLAEALTHVRGFDDSDRRFLEVGLRAFPTDAMIKLGIAYLDYQSGQAEAALSTLNEVVSRGDQTDIRARTFAESLAREWNRALPDNLPVASRELPPLSAEPARETGGEARPRWSEIEKQVAELLRAGDLTAILALVDRQKSLLRESDHDPETDEIRRNLVSLEKMTQARQAFFIFGDGELAARLLRELIASEETPADARRTAERALEQVTRPSAK